MDSPRPVLVGEVNPYDDRPFAALLDVPAGASGDRLRRLVMGVEVRRYRAFPRYDLCVRTWSAPAARARAAELLAAHPNDVFVLLGRKVADAFGMSVPTFWHSPAANGRPAMVLLPHPSGINRIWSDPSNYARARAWLIEALPLVPWGETMRPPVAEPRTCSNCGLVKAGNVCPDCGDDQGATS